MAMVFFAAASLTFKGTAPAQRLPLAAALVLALVYSLPPIRLCARPLLDLAANAVGYGGVAFLIGHLAFDDSLARGAEQAIPYVLLVGATFLHTTILDVDGDRASGKTTSSVLMGVRASALLALALVVVGMVWALAATLRDYSDVLPVVVLAVALPGFAVGAVALGRRGPADAGRRSRVSSNTVQFATLVITVAAAVVEPRYLVLIVPIVVAARHYHRARFGVTYPGAAGVASRQPPTDV
jgi:1,4-dihydroxy-2-naphthoate octaprenyltransferase